MQGFVSVNKPSGMSSGTVVAKIKKRFHIDKIGHMGTLDPMASGVLPIAIGKATRMFDYFLNKTKRYIAIFDFNYTTDTLDATGSKTAEAKKNITISDINEVLPNLVGNVMQLPPIYSAKNVGGVRAYALARKGEDVQLTPKEVFIEKLAVTREVGKNIFEFDITCGSGTYIRSIARDVAKLLDTVACMTKLERVESGKFDIASSITLDALLESENIENYLIAVDKVFDKFGKIPLDDKTLKLLNGLSVKLNVSDGTYFLMDKANAVAVVDVCGNNAKMKTYLKE